MNEYERCRRNHPSQIAADERSLTQMEDLYHVDGEEPDYQIDWTDY